MVMNFLICCVNIVQSIRNYSNNKDKCNKILTEIITQSDNLGQGSTFTLDTAANMAGSLTTVGDSIEFYLINNDQTDAITVAAGTGGTITGGTNVGPSVTAKFRVRQTNVTGGNEAYDVFRLA